MTRSLRGAAALWIATAALLVGQGCSLSKIATDQTAGLLLTGSIALDRESDLQFAREAFPASLKTLETFLINSPENKDLLLLLTKGFNSYAFVFLETDLEEARLDGTQEEVETLGRRAVLHYMRARAYGFMLLDFPELKRAALGGDLKKLGKHLKDTSKEDAPALFWVAYGWASAINLSQEDADMVGALPVVEAIMNRVVKLDKDYMAGSPMLFMGTYFASRPKMFGGDPERAQAYFEDAMARHGESNLLISFMYGRFYGAQVQDRDLFNKMMVRILEADVAKHPDLRLNNEIARHRARFWLANSDELFFE